MSDRLSEEALDYHRLPAPGKLAVVATKPLATQRDLSLAYSPGVAAACERIVAEPVAAAQMTARANLVAVVTNGTAVLGLGAIGPLAAKPVMEKSIRISGVAGSGRCRRRVGCCRWMPRGGARAERGRQQHPTPE